MAKRNPSAPTADEAAPQSAESPPTNGAVALSRDSPTVWKRRLQSTGSYIECAVIRSEGDEAQAVYSVTMQRSYKDTDGTWKEIRSLRREDLLVAAHVLQRAYAWISEQEQT
jgi:hypothetical protein